MLSFKRVALSNGSGLVATSLLKKPVSYCVLVTSSHQFIRKFSSEDANPISKISFLQAKNRCRWCVKNASGGSVRCMPGGATGANLRAGGAQALPPNRAALIAGQGKNPSQVTIVQQGALPAPPPERPVRMRTLVGLMKMMAIPLPVN